MDALLSLPLSHDSSLGPAVLGKHEFNLPHETPQTKRTRFHTPKPPARLRGCREAFGRLSRGRPIIYHLYKPGCSQLRKSKTKLKMPRTVKKGVGSHHRRPEGREDTGFDRHRAETPPSRKSSALRCRLVLWLVAFLARVSPWTETWWLPLQLRPPCMPKATPQRRGGMDLEGHGHHTRHTAQTSKTDTIFDT